MTILNSGKLILETQYERGSEFSLDMQNGAQETMAYQSCPVNTMWSKNLLQGINCTKIFCFLENYEKHMLLLTIHTYIEVQMPMIQRYLEDTWNFYLMDPSTFAEKTALFDFYQIWELSRIPKKQYTVVIVLSKLSMKRSSWLTLEDLLCIIPIKCISVFPLCSQAGCCSFSTGPATLLKNFDQTINANAEGGWVKFGVDVERCWRMGRRGGKQLHAYAGARTNITGWNWLKEVMCGEVRGVGSCASWTCFVHKTATLHVNIPFQLARTLAAFCLCMMELSSWVHPHVSLHSCFLLSAFNLQFIFCPDFQILLTMMLKD